MGKDFIYLLTKETLPVVVEELILKNREENEFNFNFIKFN